MNELTKKSQKETQIQAKSRIDSKAVILEPVDFSFKDLMSLEEINDVAPRTTSSKDLLKTMDGKYKSTSLKLGYNALKEVNGLYDWCVFSFSNPEYISSLDLSFNCFSNIPDEIMNFKGLKVLYLHGNKISNLAEVEKLKANKNLTSLTIHGNPIENLALFKYYIIAKITNLKQLNFSGISKAEKQAASGWLKSNNNKPLVFVSEEDMKNNTKKKNADSDQED